MKSSTKEVRDVGDEGEVPTVRERELSTPVVPSTVLITVKNRLSYPIRVNIGINQETKYPISKVFRAFEKMDLELDAATLTSLQKDPKVRLIPIT